MYISLEAVHSYLVVYLCDMGSQYEVSNVSRGVRCQLLEWISNEDVVIEEGEFCSSNPVYKNGRIPLGPNVAAVIVKIVIGTKSPLWRPTPTMLSFGEAVGLKIPWLVDEVINPDESQQRCKIDDWNVDGKVIAEGVLSSTNPKQMNNNIPLGQNAAIVKIDLVLKEVVYLWKPTAELLVMADAIHADFAGPIGKIKVMMHDYGDQIQK